MNEVRIGTAGWTLPREVRDRFPGDGSQLERYARVFSCVEINSSFYRPHRRTTYERWAASVPEGFRFALKLPREITHLRRLLDAGEPLARFLDESAGLGAKRDVLLVQLPPSLAFDAPVADAFFTLLRGRYPGRIACEPRHASWFAAVPDELLRAHSVARVAADPPPVFAAAEPGGAAAFTYRRLHGSPDVYWSSYDDVRLAAIAAALRAATAPAWCIFDNTSRGAAAPNALAIVAALSEGT
ncbi:MAG TPA: DUF72 domain-containing protein [Candidatus Elarobacter sp.]|jgi:uncharacterized protein YecE (DUF72 family)|nr:DUF72 domain-containing protein [Candidatus Elarobacter sp.]